MRLDVAQRFEHSVECDLTRSYSESRAGAAAGNRSKLGSLGVLKDIPTVWPIPGRMRRIATQIGNTRSP